MSDRSQNHKLDRRIMPEDKKNQQKGKSDAKEQRKPRKGRHKAGPTKTEGPSLEKNEEQKGTKFSAPQKPVYEDPGPEFYKSLKRETDEILKITEEANSKYKKKEIQSNWSKYEMPIESYEAIEEQENMGADYEQLIQMPLSVGGHFQFKHEKSWDVSVGPSPYDKYFEINMNHLANALCTIPFYERNNIEKNIFNETDLLTMNNRAVNYKQKYYNDKSYTTPELEAREKMLKNMEELCRTDKTDSKNDESGEEREDIANKSPEIICVLDDQIQLDNKIVENISNDFRNDAPFVDQMHKAAQNIDEIDELLEDEQGSVSVIGEISTAHSEKAEKCNIPLETSVPEPTQKDAKTPEVEKNLVTESPEDLEKWLDDFLEG